MDMHTRVVELLDFAFSRRNLVRGSIATAGAVALTSNVALGRAFALQGMTDLEIANFALTLEHLEARMYQQMLATNILTGKELTYFQSFGSHEAAHVDALTKMIQGAGGTPVQAQATYNFPPFNNRGDILNFAKTAEELGVGAYQGAASAISSRDILAAAGSIVQVEARHAAIVRMLMDPDTAVPQATTQSLTVEQVTNTVKPILSA